MSFRASKSLERPSSVQSTSGYSSNKSHKREVVTEKEAVECCTGLWCEEGAPETGSAC